MVYIENVVKVPSCYDVSTDSLRISLHYFIWTTFQPVFFFPMTSLMISTTISSFIASSTSFEATYTGAFGAYHDIIFFISIS